MANECLAEKAVSMVSAITEVDRMLSGFNDVGEATGFCDDYDQIHRDATQQLGALRSRALNLKRRYSKYLEHEKVG